MSEREKVIGGYKDEQLKLVEARFKGQMLGEDLVLGNDGGSLSLEDLLDLREQSSLYEENKGVIDVAIEQMIREEREQESDVDGFFDGFYEKKQTVEQLIDSLMTMVEYADNNVDLRNIDIDGVVVKMRHLLRLKNNILTPEEKAAFVRFIEKIQPVFEKIRGHEYNVMKENMNHGFKEGIQKGWRQKEEEVLMAEAQVDAELATLPDAVKAAVYMGRLVNEYVLKKDGIDVGPPLNNFSKEISFFKTNRDLLEGFPDNARKIIERVIELQNNALSVDED